MSPSTRPIRPIIAIVIALVAGACVGKTPATTVPSAPSSPPATVPSGPPTLTPITGVVSASSDAWLVAGRTGEPGVHVILASTSEPLFDLPAGIPDRTWSQLLTASTDGSTTVVRDLFIPTDQGGTSQTIDGAWQLPTIGADPALVGVSDDGKTIVLVEKRPPGTASGTTRFAIVRRALDSKPRIVELQGSFTYDALSPDGSVLYVVEHLAGPPDGHYQVRAVETATGTLRTHVVVDKSGGNEAMAGWPIAQARRPDGMVFTLYHGAEHPFIHALSSTDAWALCIDLPATGFDNAAAATDWGLAATADGAALVAANATLGLAVKIALPDLAIGRSVTFAPSASTAITLAKFGHEEAGVVGRRVVASPLGSAVYAAGPSGIVSIATADLAVTGRLLEGVPVDALAVTPDGGTIYALVHAAGRIVKLDAVSGKMVGEVPGGGFDRLFAVVPW